MVVSTVFVKCPVQFHVFCAKRIAIVEKGNQTFISPKQYAFQTLTLNELVQNDYFTIKQYQTYLIFGTLSQVCVKQFLLHHF